MQNVTLTAEEFNTWITQRETAVTEREALRCELKVVKIEHDLLMEKLNAFLRKLFGAKSEARGNPASWVGAIGSLPTRWPGPTSLRISIR